MTVSKKILSIAVVTLSLYGQNSFAQNAKFVTIDSTAASFKNADSIAARKAKALDGLTNMATATPEFKKAFNEAAVDKDYKLKNIEYYTQEYIKIPFDQYRTYSFDVSGQWVEDTYADAGYNKKVIVLRKATPEEQEHKAQAISGFYRPKAGTQIASDQTAVNALVGKPAPDFVINTLDGKKMNLKDLKGKVVVLNFWFTRCRPCIEEMPDLNKIALQYKGNKDIVFIAPEVQPQTTLEEVKTFLKRVQFEYQISLGGKDAAVLYQTKVFPSSYLIDKNGILRLGYVGNNPVQLVELKNMIPKLLESTSTTTNKSK